MKTRRILSVILAALSALLLVLCFAGIVTELLAGAVLKTVAQPHDIDYMNLVVSFGGITLGVFAGILLSCAVIRLSSSRRMTLVGKLLAAGFAVCPVFFLFC